MATEEWIYNGKTVVSSVPNKYFYELSRPGGVIGIVPIMYNEDGDIVDVYFKEAGPTGRLMMLTRATQFVSPVPSLVLMFVTANGMPVVQRTLRISNPGGNGWWEGMVADVMYYEQNKNVPYYEEKRPEAGGAGGAGGGGGGGAIAVSTTLLRF